MFGRGAGCVAGLLLAVTPISVAVDRSNNTESCLIVVLLLAAWIAMRAAETMRAGLLCLSMTVVGVGFNVKMGAALALAPTLVLAYFLFDPKRSLTRWAAQATAAGLVLIATSLAWVTIYDLTPVDQRPYVGSTSGNSMLELTLLHNGAARFIRPSQKSGEMQNANPDRTADNSDTATDREARVRLWDDSPTGILRLFRPQQAGQMTWWLPVALAGAFLGWRRKTDTDATRRRRIGIAVCGGWVATYWLLFSFAGGPFHTYYLAAACPAAGRARRDRCFGIVAPVEDGRRSPAGSAGDPVGGGGVADLILLPRKFRSRRTAGLPGCGSFPPRRWFSAGLCVLHRPCPLQPGRGGTPPRQRQGVHRASP